MSSSNLTKPDEASVLLSGRINADSEVSLNESFDDERDATTRSGKSKSKEGETIDFLQDDWREMTYGRRIARSLMAKSWYYPPPKLDEDEHDGEAEAAAAGDDEVVEAVSSGDGMEQAAAQTAGDDVQEKADVPSLEKAWAYFEHVALSRHLIEPKTGPKKGLCERAIRKVCAKGDKQMDRAEPGERDIPTKLYSPFWTPHSQLGDFGLGIGLYFSTLRAITVITFIAGLINLPNILYFASSDWVPDSSEQDDLPPLVQGSAICFDQTWVPCPTCDCNDRDRWEKNRCGNATSADGEILTFALRNNCTITEELGVVNYATMILVLIGTLFLAEYLRRQEVQFDEDEQTAQDYSVVIQNPPSDATDPAEWNEYFTNQFDAHVTVCTIAVHNDILVRTLLERRELLQTLRNILGPKTSLDVLNLARIAAEQERDRKGMAKVLALFVGGIPEMYARLVALNAKVQGLAQLDYPVTRVFLCFETEADQRKVLSKLSVGSLKAARNDHSALEDPKYLFRGNTVLSVAEPDEPNTIRWQDLNAGFLERFKQQLLTSLCTVVAIIAVAFLVGVADNSSTVGAAAAISIANIIFPLFAKALTSLEAHAAEGLKQTSLYFKIAAFRWVNTAFVISIITPFTDTLRGQGGMITQVYALFFAEIVTTNGIQLLDPMGHINRHVLAPRATTQDAMNLKFQGEVFELAERYTNMTKILFLALWYCAIFPAAFFLCSLALFINYYTDRFSLMRTWKRAPHLGTSVSKFSRRYFFSLACVAMAVISSYYWSGFPYDNLCENDAAVPAEYVGDFVVQPLSGNATDTMIAADDRSFRYCNQNFIDPGQRGDGPSFPFIAANQPSGARWMTEEQEIITNIYGWSSVGVIAIVAIVFMSGWVDSFMSLFRSSYDAVGDDMNVPFSEVPSISAYIPQVESTMFAYPLLATSCDGIDEELYDWNDPDRPFEFYDLTKDADKLLRGMDVSHKVVFSLVRHWPPTGSSNNTEQSDEDEIVVAGDLPPVEEVASAEKEE